MDTRYNSNELQIPPFGSTISSRKYFNSFRKTNNTEFYRKRREVKSEKLNVVGQTITQKLGQIQEVCVTNVVYLDVVWEVYTTSAEQHKTKN